MASTWANRAGRAVRAVGALAALLVVAGAPATGATFFVSDTVDAIPAPPGSLRWAIEQSESNGEPDRIVFLIDGGTIPLVAPLPDLLEGFVSIGEAPDVTPAGGPVGSPGIFVSGQGVVPRAIAIRSSGNRIGELQFIDFAGAEVILVSGGSSVQSNTISRCVFGQDGPALSNAGAGVRIASNPLGTGTPSGTAVYLSRFVNNDFGVLILGDVSSPGINAPGTTIAWNEFGTNVSGGPGDGTGRAISASNSGAVLVRENLFAGPGTGILLGAGTSRSEIVGNEIGLGAQGAATCAGYAGPAVEADGGVVLVEGNSILCSQEGIRLGGFADARIRRNVIGGEVPTGHASHGIALDSGAEAVIELNTIFGNGGFGVAEIPGGVVVPGDGPLVTCNAIFRNSLGAIDLPNATTQTPVLLAASPTRIEGQVMNVAGWAEVFGDGIDQSRVFQGSVRPGNLDPPLRHALPVLALTVANVAGGSAIAFDRETPAVHTATYTAESTTATSELSGPIGSDTTGLVFDLVRGGVGNLAPASTGSGIDLGPVTCLASGMDPDVAVTPNVIDPVDPPAGESFFYLARRRDLPASRPGTYDPAICLAYVDAFTSPRKPASGDCP